MNERLYQQLKPIAFDVFQKLEKKHGHEQIYTVALYTSRDFRYVCDCIATETGLRRAALEYLKNREYQDEWGTLEVAIEALRWSPTDSPHHAEWSDAFQDVDECIEQIWLEYEDQEGENDKWDEERPETDSVDEEIVLRNSDASPDHLDRNEEAEFARSLFVCREIHETFVAVLKEVRDAHIFEEGVVFNLLKGDQSFEEMYANAEQLNDADVTKRFRLALESEEQLYTEELAHARSVPWDM